MYTGRIFDPESDTFNFRSRSYSSFAGRFLSRDKTAYSAGMNLHTLYLVQSHVDPTGENPIAIPIAGGVVIITAADILGITVCACLITPRCLQLATELGKRALCVAGCDAKYAADSVTCRFLRSKKARALCWANAADRYGSCIAGCNRL